MFRVLVSPSYGSAETRRHWADTMAKEVAFTEHRLGAVLLEEQRALLTRWHPDGRAHFWGATAAHDKAMSEVARGDIVLFTGQNRVRAVGEVGVIFRNREFADLLWPPKPGGTSWHTVYSLLDIVAADIPYARLNSVIGYKPNYNYPGQILLRGDKARAVLDQFMITSGTSWSDAIADPDQIPGRASSSTSVRVAAVEEGRTRTASYERTGRLIVVERQEAELVVEYERHLIHHGQRPTRFYCSAGISDLYLEGPDEVELIEAKSNSTHSYVRQALGQLLDYAPHCPKPAHRLAGLFPSQPSSADIALLHRYGIDVIYREGSGLFERLAAPRDRRELMRRAWAE